MVWIGNFPNLYRVVFLGPYQHQHKFSSLLPRPITSNQMSSHDKIAGCQKYINEYSDEQQAY